MSGFGIPLSAADLGTIAKARNQFVAAGLSLVFQARGQPLRDYYPNLRTLLREDDRAGHQLSFLANADSAGLALGARVPIILTSRADSVRSRIASCAVAVLAAYARREKLLGSATHG